MMCGCCNGYGEYWRKHLTPILNPDFDPKSKLRYSAVTSSMVKDRYYSSHTREECKAEWRKRYEELKNNGN